MELLTHFLRFRMETPSMQIQKCFNENRNRNRAVNALISYCKPLLSHRSLGKNRKRQSEWGMYYSAHLKPAKGLLLNWNGIRDTELLPSPKPMQLLRKAIWVSGSSTCLSIEHFCLS
jgi:hypothetical protein